MRKRRMKEKKGGAKKRGRKEAKTAGTEEEGREMMFGEMKEGVEK